MLEIFQIVFQLLWKFDLGYCAYCCFQVLLQCQDLFVQHRVLFREFEKVFRHLLKKGVNFSHVKTAEFYPKLFVYDVLWRDFNLLLFHKLILLRQPFV